MARALPAGLFLAIASRQRPMGRWVPKVLVLGTLNVGGFFVLLFTAAYRLPGGVAATLGAVQPLVAGSLAALVLAERLRQLRLVAGVMGVAGVALLVLRAGAALEPVGVLAGLGGAHSMASGVVLTKRWGRPIPLLTFTAWQLVAGGLLVLAPALVIEGPPPALTVGNLVGYLWLTSAGAGGAFLLWLRGVERLPVAQVSLLVLLSPVVAAGAGWLVLGQRLTATQLAGAALVLTAVWLGQRPEPATDRSAVLRELPPRPQTPLAISTHRRSA